MSKKLSTDEFIRKAREIHGDKYDYSLVEYKKNNINVTIICPEHGKFIQKPAKHLSGQGCQKCGLISRSKKRSNTTKDFINKANKIHGDKYDYSLVKYINSKTKVKIICSKHGVFEQIPSDHYLYGCRECGYESSADIHRLSKNIFIEKAKEVHGDKYDYSLVDYKNSKTKVKIICKEHGVFEQIPSSHLKGYGCNKCGFKSSSNKNKLSKENFVKKSKEIHGNKYDYSLVDYVNHMTNVNIICINCNKSFKQTPNNHLKGKGCPKCAFIISNEEVELFKFIKNFYKEDIIQNTRKIISPYELDIYLPNKKIAIEYCGLYWHSEKMGKDRNYHYNKLDLCNKNDIRLITIFEDEWVNKKDIVKSKLRNIIGYSEKKKIYARKTIIKEVDSKSFNDFLNQNHIQGSINCKIRYGIYYNNELISVIGFRSDKRGWDLSRFASKYQVVGGFSKLLKHFIKVHNPSKIFTFADLRYSDRVNNLYNKNGFIETNITKPNYFYTTGHFDRFSRIQFQKHKLKNKLKLFDENLTEVENLNNNGYYRIFDCGNIKYEMIL